MNYQQLQCFVTLAETRNFNRASSRSYMSPSAFSRIIQRTEDELGVELCVRNTRELFITTAGERFLSYAREALAEYENVRQQLHSGEVSGDLSIFATVTACYSILPKVLNPFRKAYPGVTIHLRTGDAADALDAVRMNRVDCSVAPIPDTSAEDLFVQVLTATPLVFVAPWDEFRKELEGFPVDAPWDELPIILPERGLARERIDTWFRSRAIHPRIRAEAAGNEGILSMVNLGLGIGLVPELVVVNSPLTEGLEILPHIDEVPDFQVGVAAKQSRRANPALRAFMQSAMENLS